MRMVGDLAILYRSLSSPYRSSIILGLGSPGEHSAARANNIPGLYGEVKDFFFGRFETYASRFHK